MQAEPKVANVVLHFRVEFSACRKHLAGENAATPPAKLLHLQQQQNHRRRRSHRRRSRHRKNGNFYVLSCLNAEERWSFTIFPGSGHVIATGISDVDDIDRCVLEFCERVGCRSEDLLRVRVVNTTFVGSVRTVGLGEPFSACKLLSLNCNVTNGGEAHVSFRSQFFPGVRVKWPCMAGTANVFNNGKYVLVGVTDKSQALQIHNQLCALMTER